MEEWKRPFVWLLLFFVFLLLSAALFLPAECGGDLLGRLCYLLGVKTKEGAIRGLSLAVVGLLSMLAIWSAYRRAEAMQKQTLAAENRLVQERFRDAVQHLGHETESVRLGGAYALFRLALEEDAFRRQIAEILCAHILSVTGAKKYRENFAKTPSMEIQSLMRLLFSAGQDDRTENSRKAFWKDLRADLSGGYFHGLKLSNARFQSAFLTGAQFRGASLDDAEFHGAFLVGAEFQGALLVRAEFQGARLSRAEFQGSSLVGAEFQGAFLEGAEFHGARLSRAEFQGSSLVGAEFHGARLSRAEFHGARLSRAEFQGSSLVGAEFHGARLSRAKFQGAFLEDAQFQGASLENAQFQGVTSSAEYVPAFEQRIREKIDRDADLSAIVFAGGLRQEQIERWVAGLKKGGRATESKIAVFRQRVSAHVGTEKSHELPDGAQGGRYGEEEADRWIEEYEQAMEKAEAKAKAAGGDNEVKQP